MKFIDTYKEGDVFQGVYICRTKGQLTTKTGKPYDNLTLADRTGTVNAKVWYPNDPAISEYGEGDYVNVIGEVTKFNNALQVRINRLRVAAKNEYDPADYMPSTEKDVDEMSLKLSEYIGGVENRHLKRLLQTIFQEDPLFSEAFKAHSAAKVMHHSFVGGLLEHTLNVAGLCEDLCRRYPALNRDLLITGALCHDIGKVRELSEFPQNDYTDEGQLVGHIVIGAEIIHDKVREIPDFPEELERELKHMILSHHGELEFGSPKRPAMLEALALNLADNADAKMEMFMEFLKAKKDVREPWAGFHKTLDTYIRRTEVQE